MVKYSTSNKSKPRTIITETHLETLKSHFDSDSRPSKQIRAQLAKKLELSEESIRIWFQNRRTKARSTGELPAICRSHGNRFITSSQLTPTYTPNFSPLSNYSNFTVSPASLSPTYPPVDFNYLPMNTSINQQLNSVHNSSQFQQSNFNFMTAPMDNTHSIEKLLQEFLASLPTYSTFY